MPDLPNLESLREPVAPPQPRKRFSLTPAPRLKQSQKIFFVQQLGVMVHSGIALAVALKTLQSQSTNAGFRKILSDIEAEVEKGNLLSRGLELHRRAFGDLFINMVKAGEASGRLEEVMRQLYIQLKKDHDIVSKVRGAMIYPTIVIVMMLAIGTLMMIYVVPSITSVFKELNVVLPLPTRILIGLSDFIVHSGLWVALGGLGIGVGLVAFVRNPSGRRIYHGLLLRLPIIGPITKKINIARFCRTLSSLLKTDIPIIDSLDITGHVLGNALFSDALDQAKEKIKKGVTIQASLEAYPKLFPPVIQQMIAVGEQTGALDDILAESADFYEEEISQTMSNLPAIIEPVLIVVLGIAVGGMAVAIIMPIYSLSEAI